MFNNTGIGIQSSNPAILLVLSSTPKTAINLVLIPFVYLTLFEHYFVPTALPQSTTSRLHFPFSCHAVCLGLLAQATPPAHLEFATDSICGPCEVLGLGKRGQRYEGTLIRLCSNIWKSMCHNSKSK